MPITQEVKTEINLNYWQVFVKISQGSKKIVIAWSQLM
jgi:hypothetical protein